MRLIRAPQSACDRAREALSLGLDGELSELERARLDLHLEGCAECRAFEGGTVAATQFLRDAPLEQMSVPIVLPRARRLSVVRLMQASAAAAAVALIAGHSAMHGVAQRQSASAVPYVKLSPTAGLGRDDELSPVAKPALTARTGHSIPL